GGGLRAFQRNVATLGAAGALLDAVARLGQQARRALLALTHPLGQLARGALVALMPLIRAFRQAAADVVQSLGRATLGLGDAFAEPVRDPGDLAAEPLQRQGVLIVGLSQALVHRLGVASQIALQLLFQR